MELKYWYLSNEGGDQIPTAASTKVALDELEKWLKSITTAFDQHVKDEPPEYSAMAVMSGSIEDAEERITRIDGRLETLEAKPGYKKIDALERRIEELRKYAAHGGELDDRLLAIECLYDPEPYNKCIHDKVGPCEYGHGYRCKRPCVCHEDLDAKDAPGKRTYLSKCPWHPEKEKPNLPEDADACPDCGGTGLVPYELDVPDNQIMHGVAEGPCPQCNGTGKLAPTCGNCSRPARWNDDAWSVVCLEETENLQLKSVGQPACPHYGRRRS